MGCAAKFVGCFLAKHIDEDSSIEAVLVGKKKQNTSMREHLKRIGTVQRKQHAEGETQRGRKRER